MRETKRGALALKFLVGFAVGTLLGFGLCGVNLGRAIGGDSHAERMTTIGGNIFALCMWGVIGCFIWWVVTKGKGR